MNASHPPPREAALRRLNDFLPHAGRDYTSKRNYDLPGHPHVSVLSPYIRHRLLTEEEVLSAVLGRFSLSSAEKFVQEVFWRTYWKGWLELRPGVWDDYKSDLDLSFARMTDDPGLLSDWEAACGGETGIDAFDHWAKELVETGYMHNHARMWFASIWVFTLDLPWELGADFFLRHLLDGDPASNTLSWRWVAGLQTRGKHYVARSSNISKYTEGRFNPGYRLNTQAMPLDGPPAPERQGPPLTGYRARTGRIGLVLTEEDLAPGFLLKGAPVDATLVVNGATGRSPKPISENVRTFIEGALADCVARHGELLGEVTGPVTAAEAQGGFDDWVAQHDLDQVVMAYAPRGPARDGLAALLAEDRITEIIRDYDQAAWPFATAGFFKFKAKIPTLVAAIGRAQAA
ncbi:MAG: FAD-binding domain-containing protein [Pseudomonadota bacterium]